MEIVGIIVGFGALLLGAFAMRAVLLLRSTVDTDRARIAESLRRHRAALDAAFSRQEQLAQQGSTVVVGIQGLCSTMDDLRREVVSIGEDARLARREVTRLAAAGAARVPEAAPAAPRSCARPEDPDGEVTLFFERPANDGAPDRPPITPTKLSPAPAPKSPKA